MAYALLLYTHSYADSELCVGQIGCRKGGAWYEDYSMIGGQHRYAVDQYGGGRTAPQACALARLWHTANITAAGLPMM